MKKKMADAELTNMYILPLFNQTRLNVRLNNTARTLFDTYSGGSGFESRITFCEVKVPCTSVSNGDISRLVVSVVK